jgi:hypothetical protein
VTPTLNSLQRQQNPVQSVTPEASQRHTVVNYSTACTIPPPHHSQSPPAPTPTLEHLRQAALITYHYQLPLVAHQRPTHYGPGGQTPRPQRCGTTLCPPRLPCGRQFGMSQMHPSGCADQVMTCARMLCMQSSGCSCCRKQSSLLPICTEKEGMRNSGHKHAHTILLPWWHSHPRLSKGSQKVHICTKADGEAFTRAVRPATPARRLSIEPCALLFCEQHWSSCQVSPWHLNLLSATTSSAALAPSMVWAPGLYGDSTRAQRTASTNEPTAQFHHDDTP